MVTTTPVYDCYWQFAAERQAIWQRRRTGSEPPWTEDHIIAQFRFTNAYRVADRVSQYLIRNVIYRGDMSPREVFFRILLFKLFNRIETWEWIESHTGEVRWSEYSFERYSELLGHLRDSGQPLYSAAYIMPSAQSAFGYQRKHLNHLRLIELMVKENAPERLQETASLKSAYELLRSYPSIGPFLAYQYVIDLNYSELINHSEMEYVVAGPGAKSGIRKCFVDLGSRTDEYFIRLMTEHQEEEFSKRNLEFTNLWGRPLQLIDCQNLFCETDKYARVAHPRSNSIDGRTRIKQRFRLNEKPIDYWFPPKWGLNEKVVGARLKKAVKHETCELSK